MANPIVITCNSTDISNSVDWKSIDAVSQLTKDVGTFKFNVRIGSGQTYPVKTVPVVGNIINLSDSTGLIWAGTVTETEATIEGLMITWQITCTDWGYLFNGTLIRQNYSQLDPHDIVLDIVAQADPGSLKGFTTNHVQMGNFLVPSIKFNYQQPSKALQSLANLIGWDWYIDPNKDIHFFLGDVDDGVGEGGVAPITVDGTSGEIEWNSLDVDQNLTNMQNSVYVIGGTYTKTFTAANTVDTFLTDGVTQFFSVSYAYEANASAYNTVPFTVTLNGVSQTIGIANQDDPADFQVMYNDAQRWIQFTAGAPSTGKTVKAFGSAKVPIVAHASNSASIATYGEYQGVITDSKITSVPEAQARATAQILQFGHPVYDVKFNTLVAGCKIGQAITVNLPAFGINEQLIIKRIEAVGYAPGANGMLEYQIECIGSDVVTFTDLMQSILQQEANQTTVDDSTVIEDLLPIPEGITATDLLHLLKIASRPYIWGGTQVFQKDTNESLITGLTSYFSMEGDALDIYGSNYGNDTAVTYSNANGKVGEGAGFNGSSSQLALVNTITPGTGAFSISCWVNKTATGNEDAIMGSSSNPFNGLFFPSGSSYYFFIGDGGINSALWTIAKSTFSGYTHVVMIWTGAAMELFVNGTSQGAPIISGTVTGLYPINTIGYVPSTTHFTGDIDEVGFWSKALSAQEISDLYNSGNGQTMAYTNQSQIRWGFFSWT